MSGKPESKNQRLERIATQLLAGLTANARPQACSMNAKDAVQTTLIRAKELIKQLDEQAEAD